MSKSEKANSDLESFQKHKALYRRQRDKFRKNDRAMKELSEWKDRNKDYDYEYLRNGLIPAERVGKAVGGQPYLRCDTWFSDLKSHDKSMILNETSESYIIGNLASYDKRQYPRRQYLESTEKEPPTPEGQGFGHSFVIPRKRVFNIVDPDATAQNAALLKELKAHFVSFWETEGGIELLIKSTRNSFDRQNTKLEKVGELSPKFSEELEADFQRLASKFALLKASDFEYGFHAYPDNSVGHLHLHVFPKARDLREFSSKHHDSKTIPLDAVLEVEEEDELTKPKGGS